MRFRSQGLGAGVLVAVEVLVLLTPLSGWSQGICVCALTACTSEGTAFISGPVTSVYITDGQFALVPAV